MQCTGHFITRAYVRRRVRCTSIPFDPFENEEIKPFTVFDAEQLIDMPKDLSLFLMMMFCVLVRTRLPLDSVSLAVDSLPRIRFEHFDCVLLRFDGLKCCTRFGGGASAPWVFVCRVRIE